MNLQLIHQFNKNFNTIHFNADKIKNQNKQEISLKFSQFQNYSYYINFTGINFKISSKIKKIIKKETPLINNDNNSIPYNIFFIRMKHYGKHIVWARKMSDIAENTSKQITQNTPFNGILFYVASEVHNLNGDYYGILKDYFPKHYLCYPYQRGEEYFEKYQSLCKDHLGYFKCKSNSEYADAATCKIESDKLHVLITYGFETKKNNLKFVRQAYNKLKSIPNPTKKDVVETAATIQWLIAQATPYVSGSDSIATILSRSLMHSYGCTLSPLKEGISCDFEAFANNLDDYIKKYPDFFEKNPLFSN